ncbi:hypothetical protein TNCV_651271 [Trichonephila clavipes]|nr:hypothetical protein TNCV_651271 [Trichonephila clavipes]
MLEKVIENWTSRLDYIRASRGSPIPEIIFKMSIHDKAVGAVGTVQEFGVSCTNSSDIPVTRSGVKILRVIPNIPNEKLQSGLLIKKIKTQTNWLSLELERGKHQILSSNAILGTWPRFKVTMSVRQ